MTKTGLRFILVENSLNDNAIKILRKNNIDYHYNHFFELVANFYRIGLFQKVDYVNIGHDEFEICIGDEF